MNKSNQKEFQTKEFFKEKVLLTSNLFKVFGNNNSEGEKECFF